MNEKQRIYAEALKRTAELVGKTSLTDAESNEMGKLAERLPAMKAQLDQEELVNAAFNGLPGVSDEGPHGANGGSIFETIKAQTRGDFLNGKAHIPATMFGAKSDLIATQANANPTGVSGGVAAIGADGRFAFPVIPTEGLSLDPATTRVDFLQQTTRTLPAVGDMQLALDSSGTKPVTDSVAALASVEPIWIATISNPQPNALFGQPALKDMLGKDMAYAYAKSLDDKVTDVIAAASGANTATQGGNIVLDAIRRAQALVHDDGFSGDTLILPSSVKLDLDLLKDADERYYGVEKLGEWFKNVRSSLTLASTAVQIVSSESITLHTSPVVYEADTSLYFETNRTVARYEGLVAVVVRQGTSVCLLTLD